MDDLNRNKATGQTGESFALQYLEKNDFSILERNWRHKRWEVDIIATKDNILHFFEVKTRTSTRYGFPETAVSQHKMNCLKNAAEAYQLLFPQWRKVQFNVIAIQLHLHKIKEIFVNWDVYF